MPDAPWVSTFIAIGLMPVAVLFIHAFLSRKATRLIEFAAEQRLDAVLLNNLNYFESLETSHLRKLRDLARQHEIAIYIGAGGICVNAAKFSDKYGDAEALVAKAIEVHSKKS